MFGTKISPVLITMWMQFKPYDEMASADKFYLSLANKIRKLLVKPKYRDFVDGGESSYSWPDFLAVFLTSYLEDLVSGIQIWNTFTQENKKRTGRELPFVNLDEYYTEEINPQDVTFLLWYYKDQTSTGGYVYKEDSILQTLSEEVYAILDSHWDAAPVNVQWLNWLRLADEVDDGLTYYRQRDVLLTLLFETYLFAFDANLSCYEELSKIEDKPNAAQAQAFIEHRTYTEAYTMPTSLLGWTASEWYLATGHGNSFSRENIRQLQARITSPFVFLRQTEQHYVFKDVINKEEIPMLSSSFDDRKINLKFQEGMLYTLGMTKWRGKWWYSGLCAPHAFDITEETYKIERDPLDYLYAHDNITPNRSTRFLERESENAYLHQSFMEVSGQNSFVQFSGPEEFAAFCDKLSLALQQRPDNPDGLKDNCIERVASLKEGFAEYDRNFFFLSSPETFDNSAIDEIEELLPDLDKPTPLGMEEQEENIRNLLWFPEEDFEIIACFFEHYRHQIPFLATEDGQQVVENLAFYMKSRC